MNTDTPDRWDILESKLTDLGCNPMMPTQLHGYFTAIIIGPEMVPPSVWLPFLYSPEGEHPVYDSMDQMQEITGLIMELYNETARELTGNAFSPMFEYDGEKGEEVYDPFAWCIGFNQGLSLMGDEWLQAEDGEMLAKLLSPVYFFLDDVPDSSALQAEPGVSDDELEAEMTDMIPDVVMELNKYWKSKRMAKQPNREPGLIVPFKRESTPGRNDPCSCGSGKKFKHCCGR